MMTKQRSFENGKRLRIGITDNFRPRPFFDNYIQWLQAVDPEIEAVKISYLLDNGDEIGAIDGLLLTGGGDIHPQYYGRPDAIDQVEEVNEHRDEFELNLVDRALGADLPILAVCRGMQLINVALGGSLVVDVEAAGFSSHRPAQPAERIHDLHVDPHAMLFFAAGGATARVNSIHHQSVDRVGRGMKPVAFAPDGVIEALEWVQKDGMPYFQAVQWHPERQRETEFSKNIATLFIKGAAAYHADRADSSVRASGAPEHRPNQGTKG